MYQSHSVVNVSDLGIEENHDGKSVRITDAVAFCLYYAVHKNEPGHRKDDVCE